MSSIWIEKRFSLALLFTLFAKVSFYFVWKCKNFQRKLVVVVIVVVVFVSSNIVCKYAISSRIYFLENFTVAEHQQMFIQDEMFGFPYARTNLMFNSYLFCMILFECVCFASAQQNPDSTLNAYKLKYLERYSSYCFPSKQRFNAKEAHFLSELNNLCVYLFVYYSVCVTVRNENTCSSVVSRVVFSANQHSQCKQMHFRIFYFS